MKVGILSRGVVRAFACFALLACGDDTAANGGGAGSAGAGSGGASAEAGRAGAAGQAGASAAISGSGGADAGSGGSAGASGAVCDLTCDPGSHCELIQVECIRAPCPPEKSCVPNA